MRGKLDGIGELSQAQRITPACAGKTSVHMSCCRFFSDHPRVCGENSDWWLEREQAIGSPPRVRGKLDQTILDEMFGRITPACAGKTFVQCVGPSAVADHPRVCGEN